MKVLVKFVDKELIGWEDVSIKRSLDSLCGSFTLSIFDDPPEFTPDKNDNIKVLIDDNLLITGYLDERQIEISSNSYSLSISGRDKTADLVDCGIENPPFVFTNQTIGQVATKLCQPFSIKVDKSYDTRVFKSMTYEIGQSIFSFLYEYSQKNGCLLTSNEKGDFKILNPSFTQNIGKIKEGYGTLKLNRSEKFDIRFSKYIVKGKSLYDTAKATESDSSVKRYRPLILNPDKPLTTEACKEYAKYEKMMRLTKNEINLTLDDWYSSKDILYSPGKLINLESSTLRVDDEFLIKSVEFVLSNSEYSTNLVLVNKNAYNLDKSKDTFYA